jgi:hypothetical protein
MLAPRWTTHIRLYLFEFTTKLKEYCRALGPRWDFDLVAMYQGHYGLYEKKIDKIGTFLLNNVQQPHLVLQNCTFALVYAILYRVSFYSKWTSQMTADSTRFVSCFFLVYMFIFVKGTKLLQQRFLLTWLLNCIL